MAQQEHPSNSQIRDYLEACFDGGPAEARKRGLEWIETHLYIERCPECYPKISHVAKSVRPVRHDRTQP